MMKNYNIAVIVGSLRKESYNLKTANALIALAPESLSLEILDISDLPMFNEDLEATPPNEWEEFRRQIRSADGLLFLTPEYNRSVPAVLKNAIDVGSRPYGQNSWNGKPGAVVSVSIGNISGFGANHHLRQSLVFVNVPTMAQPEAYIAEATGLFDENGSLINDSTKSFLTDFMVAFEQWVTTHATKN
ncbi:NAD(P)H-dependent oxidoreductase [Dyadobacter sp. CY351]|uniref:NAD(P)H-dependent oxidoreductase n=3 Tax=Spirosomataceae TaxID=2896860 RepID=A0A9X1PB02_9BACT|nr:NAD(P)H-dependent oxidoreductase [Dyadobacter fanqingshengii]MCF2494835.1 NAD(P)H-dependent oxidoreductase [Dyadobacter chenhuakuii]MCF2519086.1 NAD(P)H-dependent oxidoreductase [Dyadobacter sp. CY351]USJ33535.1 NAD(P)H-dependent oxidoreductase [Dyadobacter chenhuakuii]USJ38706.1 NAD(P)H-dependent oxidoreductase [Dyadobacter fanqingshengii]